MQEEIRKIWEEMKLVKKMHEGNTHQEFDFIKVKKLEQKYENIEILFGHESTLSKAIIYYLDSNK